MEYNFLYHSLGNTNKKHLKLSRQLSSHFYSTKVYAGLGRQSNSVIFPFCINPKKAVKIKTVHYMHGKLGTLLQYPP